jgi:hypothetical protein
MMAFSCHHLSHCFIAARAFTIMYNNKLLLLSIISTQDCTRAFVASSNTNIQREATRRFSTVSEIGSTENIVHRDDYDGDAWEKGFQNVEQESCYELDGDFPTDLEGTFFQNGHTKFYVSDDEFHVHPFDADGMVQAVTFQNGKAWFRNRYVKTPGYQQELKENKVCKRGVFGTARNKGKWYSNIFDVDFK